MFEHYKEKPLASRKFRLRLLRSVLAMLGLIACSFLIGLIGYKYLEHMPWDDAILNAATTLAGTGPLNKVATTAGKIFVALYSVYCSIVLLIAIWILIAPVIHRLLHNLLHLPDEKDSI